MTCSFPHGEITKVQVSAWPLFPWYHSSHSLLNPYSASCCPSPACHGTYQPQALSGCGWPPKTWAVTVSALKLSSLLPKVWCSPSDTLGQSDPSGHPANIHLARSVSFSSGRDTTIYQFVLVQGPTTATKALLISGLQPAQQDVCTAS